MKKTYKIAPMSKPRMTQRDKWAARPPVLAYFAFKEHTRYLGMALPSNGAHVVFKVPMPKSWSNKKKQKFDGQPHQQRPDVDNLTKALLDAIFDEDSEVWDIRTTKLWAYEGAIEINCEANQ